MATPRKGKAKVKVTASGKKVSYGRLAEEKKERKEKAILLADQQKLNVHQQPKKKLALKELVGKTAE
jgi:hypothetical protein